MHLVFTGAFLISFAPVFVRLAHVGPTVAALYRVGIAGAVLLAWALFTRTSLSIRGRALGAMAIACGAYYLDLFSWHRSIHAVGPGMATLLANFQVLFVPLLGYLVYRHRPHPRFYPAALMALAGLFLLTAPGWSGFTSDYKTGILFGLAAALFYAVFLLGLRRSGTGQGGVSTFAVVALYSLGSAPLFLASSLTEGESLAIPDIQSLLALAALALGCHVGGWLAIARGLTRAPAHMTAIALLLQPALALFWDFLFFGRRFGILEITGAVVCLAGIRLGLSGPKPPAPIHPETNAQDKTPNHRG